MIVVQNMRSSTEPITIPICGNAGDPKMDGRGPLYPIDVVPVVTAYVYSRKRDSGSDTCVDGGSPTSKSALDPNSVDQTTVLVGSYWAFIGASHWTDPDIGRHAVQILHEINEEHCCGGALKITTVGHSNGRR